MPWDDDDYDATALAVSQYCRDELGLDVAGTLTSLIRAVIVLIELLEDERRPAIYAKIISMLEKQAAAV